MPPTTPERLRQQEFTFSDGRILAQFPKEIQLRAQELLAQLLIAVIREKEGEQSDERQDQA